MEKDSIKKEPDFMGTNFRSSGLLLAQWAPYLQSTLRIVAAVMFILAGTTKLFGFPAGIHQQSTHILLMSQLGFGAILEVFGGPLLFIGLFTRPVAFILSGEMAVAYFQFHFPLSIWPNINGGIPAVLYCFIWLYFSAVGAGPLSLDAKWESIRTRKPS